MKKPGGLQSMGLQKVRHKLMTEHALGGTNIFRGLLCAMCIISFNLTIILRRGAICIFREGHKPRVKLKGSGSKQDNTKVVWLPGCVFSLTYTDHWKPPITSSPRAGQSSPHWRVWCPGLSLSECPDPDQGKETILSFPGLLRACGVILTTSG